MEQADTHGDGIPTRRKGRSKGGEAKERVTNAEGNGQALSDTSCACSEGFSLSIISSQVPISLSPET